MSIEQGSKRDNTPTSKGKLEDMARKNPQQLFIILRKQLSLLMVKARQTIWRAFKRFTLRRKFLTARVVEASLYWEDAFTPSKKVELVGSFTSPPWSVRIPMRYSLFFRAYYVRATLALERDEFKFVINGTYACSPRYPIVYTMQNIQNNRFILLTKRRSLHSPIASKTPPLKKAPPLVTTNPTRYKTTKALRTPNVRSSFTHTDRTRVSRISCRLRRQVTNDEPCKASPLFKTKPTTP